MCGCAHLLKRSLENKYFDATHHLPVTTVLPWQKPIFKGTETKHMWRLPL